MTAINVGTKDLFLLGAGFSRSMYPHMPLMSDLTDKLAGHKSVQRWQSLGNIEEILTYLGQSLPWDADSDAYRNRADFFEITRLLAEEISERQSRAPEDDILDHPMTPLFKRWHENQTQIITLNYDSLVEEGLFKLFKVQPKDYFPVMLTNAQSRDGVGLLGGYHKPTVTIYKLHGSVTWYYSGNESFYGESIFIGPRQLPIDSNDPYRRGLLDKVPLIVPPTFEKSSFFRNETIRAVWKLAGKAIQATDRIIIVGYSLPDSDLMMRYFLKANFIGKNKKEIIVVDPTKEVFRRLRRHFRSVANVRLFECTSLNPATAFAVSYSTDATY
jgi:hypothetical protein